MSNSEGISGIDSYLLYGAESTYSTPVAADTHFSSVVSNWRWNINPSTKKHYGFSGTAAVDGRKVQKYTFGFYDVGASLEMSPSNFAFMEYVLGTVAGAGPYTYTVSRNPSSLTVATDIDNPGTSSTDQECMGQGGVFESVTIKSSSGEAMTVTADMKFAYVVLDTTLSSRTALPDETPYNFIGGDIELPASSSLSNIIDSIDLTIRNNFALYPGMNIVAQNALSKGLDLQVKVTLKYLDNALFTAALGGLDPSSGTGPTEYATMVLNFENVDGDTFEITLSRVPLSGFAQIHKLQDPIMEELTFDAGDISCVETLA